MEKTILITGCSSGIGRALAIRFKEKGCRVIATARNVDSLKNIDGVDKVTLDINSPESIRNALEKISEKTDSIDILVNNAGYAAMGPLVEMPEAVLEDQFRTNVFSQVSLLKAFLPHLKKTGGAVVNISSVSGDITTPFAGAYCSTKAALSSLSDALRMELKPFGIRVINVKPGAIESEFGRTAHKNVSSWLKSNSDYISIKDAIIARARASQNSPTTAEIFAGKLVNILLLKNPPSVIRFGKGSFALNILAKWFPLKIRDAILSKKFKLDKLNTE